MINLINLEIKKDVWIIIKPKTNKGINKAKEDCKRLWWCLNCFLMHNCHCKKAEIEQWKSSTIFSIISQAMFLVWWNITKVFPAFEKKIMSVLNEEFEKICRKLKFHYGFLSYLQFLAPIKVKGSSNKYPGNWNFMVGFWATCNFLPPSR